MSDDGYGGGGGGDDYDYEGPGYAPSASLVVQKLKSFADFAGTMKTPLSVSYLLRVFVLQSKTKLLVFSFDT